LVVSLFISLPKVETLAKLKAFDIRFFFLFSIYGFLKRGIGLKTTPLIGDWTC
jgi:hypothetical protein